MSKYPALQKSHKTTEINKFHKTSIRIHTHTHNKGLHSVLRVLPSWSLITLYNFLNWMWIQAPREILGQANNTGIETSSFDNTFGPFFIVPPFGLTCKCIVF